MFHRIVVRGAQRDVDQEPLDVGALVEAMVFYGETQLQLTLDVIKHLARVWTPAGMLELAEEGLLRFAFTNQIAGISTDNTETHRERYGVVQFSVHSQQGTPAKGWHDWVPSIFEEVSGRRGYARRMAARLSKHVAPVPTDNDIVQRVKSDLLDSPFARAAVRRLLAELVPKYVPPPELLFELDLQNDGLRLRTNVDFEQANALYHLNVSPAHSTLNPAFLMMHVLSAREMLEAAMRADADLAAPPAHSAVASLKVDSVIRRSRGAGQQIDGLQELVLDNGRAIREAVNSGERGVRDIIELVKHARRFRQWVATAPADASLVKEYVRACTQETWAERTPAKVVKWVLMTGAGMTADLLGAGGLGTAIGVGLSAADGFLLDPLLRGWRPSVFVEQHLRKFVRSDRASG